MFILLLAIKTKSASLTKYLSKFFGWIHTLVDRDSFQTLSGLLSYKRGKVVNVILEAAESHGIILDFKSNEEGEEIF